MTPQASGPSGNNVERDHEKAVFLRKLVPGFRLDWSGLRNRFDDIAAHLDTLKTYEARSAYLDELARDFEDAISAYLRASTSNGEPVTWQDLIDIRDALLSPVNSLAIHDTLWMPEKPVPIETVIDRLDHLIDRALAKGSQDGTDA